MLTLMNGVNNSSVLAADGYDMKITVDLKGERKEISPLIYGVNQYTSPLKDVRANAVRQGGNRMTAYNWETNASNAGSDWKHSSDTNLSESDDPADCVQVLSKDAEKYGVGYKLTTLQLAGYVVTSEFKDGVKDMDNEACPAVIYGDINEDGRLDSLDYVTYRKAVLEEFKVTRYNEYYRKCADIDGDGKITVTDMVRVGLYLIGKSRQVCFDDTESSFTEGKRYYSEYFKNSVGYSNCTSDKLNIMNCTLNHTDDACFENGVILDASRPVYELDSLKAIYYMKLQVPETQGGYEFGIHGSFVDSDDEFYIAEASHRSSRFRDIEPSACFESDGYTYDIYMLPKEKTKNGKTVKYTEYWSVLRNLSENSYDEVFVENCADIIDHINAWTDVSGKQICQLTAEKVGWFWRAFNADYAVVHLNSFDVIEK